MIERGYVPKRETRRLIADALQTTVGALWPDEDDDA